jgi:transcriptional regulator with XRE-family HTH domain
MAAQWAPEDIPGGPFVPIGERIRALRSERGWSQDELATKISAAGAHQISRYENGKITPATKTVVRLAEIFDVSIDYLLVDEAPRRPLHIPDRGLADRLSVELADLSDTERDSVLLFVEALQAKNRLKALVAGLS